MNSKLLGIAIIVSRLHGEPIQEEPKPTPSQEQRFKEEDERKRAIAADNKRLDELIKKKYGDREEKRKRDIAVAKKKREEAISRQPKDVQDLIRKRRIRIGLNAEQVVLSWGKPEHINRTIYSFGVHEQWVYNSQTYVYFENGKVTTIQN